MNIVGRAFARALALLFALVAVSLPGKPESARAQTPGQPTVEFEVRPATLSLGQTATAVVTTKGLQSPNQYVVAIESLSPSLLQVQGTASRNLDGNGAATFQLRAASSGSGGPVTVRATIRDQTPRTFLPPPIIREAQVRVVVATATPTRTTSPTRTPTRTAVPAALGATLRLSSTEVRVGDELSASAQVTAGGKPVRGISVRFTTTGPLEVVGSQDQTTGADGTTPEVALRAGTERGEASVTATFLNAAGAPIPPVTRSVQVVTASSGSFPWLPVAIGVAIAAVVVAAVAKTVTRPRPSLQPNVTFRFRSDEARHDWDPKSPEVALRMVLDEPPRIEWDGEPT
ncbi:MAG TPA: hypothetical protein VJB57_19150 [Dehalococcoidia bacterium]|nr:hypothetical protein [Dehalococcoidia bacterium]